MGWESGAQVGSYEIVAPLGNGGMGQVYKVRHLISQRVEAMKVLLPNASQKEDLTNRFLREIRVVATLNHPHIAALHNAFRQEDQLIMVMEFVEGANLSERLAAGLTLGQSVGYISQVLSALDYAHSRDVIHRDLKPSNIMITPDERVKLLDFGLALSSPDPRLTLTGALLGSVHYMSPEQIRGESLDARSDIYALGVTLYELVTGQLPIKGQSFGEIIASHLQQVPVAPASVNPAVSAGLSTVIMRSIAKDREHRFQTAAEFLKALMTVELRSGAEFRVTATWSGMQTPQAIPMTPQPKPPSSGSGSKGNYEPAVLDEISRNLATYIGPIAKIIVKRASGSSLDLRQLCDSVAKEIDSPAARESFLASVRKHLRASGGY